jgi:FixJ family two-component response regulator
MSGFDLQRKLAEAGAREPVVFITGDAEAVLAERAAAAGCALLRKSDPGTAVVATIRRAVAESGLPHGAVADGGHLPHVAP